MELSIGTEGRNEFLYLELAKSAKYWCNSNTYMV